jgi:hypothetical protein
VYKKRHYSNNLRHMAQSDMTAMTAVEYRETIDALGFTQGKAGRWVGVMPNSGRRWAYQGCPAWAAKMLRIALYLQSLGMTPHRIDDLIVQEQAMRARIKAGDRAIAALKQEASA